MFRSKKTTFSVSFAKGALESIFDECDQFDVDESGGRLIGTYHQKGAHYDIQVQGIIGPGPNARRSPTSFFQDGEYQEQIFRSIEKTHPTVEHLGNWHTHHVNGYPTLSGGDKTTYFNIVNHKNHNTDFFYALLVVRKNARGNPRYEVKHYFFRRNDNTEYEVPHSRVRLINTPIIWPREAGSHPPPAGASHLPRDDGAPNLERAKDQEFFAEFYPNLKALFSKAASTLYWKGSMALVDGSRTDVVAMESIDDGAPSYSITTSSENSILANVTAKYKERRFRSARHAVLQLERDLNQAIFRNQRGIIA